jgi:hypothetical protein
MTEGSNERETVILPEMQWRTTSPKTKFSVPISGRGLINVQIAKPDSIFPDWISSRIRTSLQSRPKLPGRESKAEGPRLALLAQPAGLCSLRLSAIPARLDRGSRQETDGPRQQHRAENRYQDCKEDAARRMKADEPHEKPADDSAGYSEDDVHPHAVSFTFHNFSRYPASDESDNDPPQNRKHFCPLDLVREAAASKAVPARL